MVKAGALYFSIIIAFVIAVLCAALLLLAAHYRNSYLKELRFGRLLRNMDGGIAVALSSEELLDTLRGVDLYQQGTDSVALQYQRWGIYQLVFLKAFIQKDTLKRAVLLGTNADSTAIYLSDEDRSLSLSGDAKVVGDVSVPKSGLKKAYVDGRPFSYEKLVEKGSLGHSERLLPKLDSGILASLGNGFKKMDIYTDMSETHIMQSFYRPTLYFDVSARSKLTGLSMRGNIIIRSDTLLRIAASCELDGIQVYAPGIVIENGFRGRGQFFATDSIIIGDKVSLLYPSVAAVLRTPLSTAFPKLLLGKSTLFEGVLLTYEQQRSPLQTMLSIDSASLVHGEVYITGVLKFAKGITVKGKVSCNSFLMQRGQSIYENFLIDLTINTKARNRYYASSRLFRYKGTNKVLQWLK